MCITSTGKYKHKYNNIGGKKKPTHSLTTYHFPAHPPSLFSSPLLLSPRSLSGSLFPAAHTALVREDEDKTPNKVHLNIEAARPFPLCPYKELLVNPDGQSSSLHQELIPPSRTGTITAGAWKHTRTHMHTHTRTGCDVLLEMQRERDRETPRGGFFCSTQAGKSILVEHTKIGEVWGNFGKTRWEKWRALREIRHQNMEEFMSKTIRHRNLLKNSFCLFFRSNVGS